MCRQINIHTARNAMAVPMYLYSQLRMHRTLHEIVENFNFVWQGESRLKVSAGAFNPLLLGIGRTKKAQVGL
jgi:hypothetical protein